MCAASIGHFHHRIMRLTMWTCEAVFTQLQCKEVTQINAIRLIHFKVTIRLQLQKVTIHMSFIPVASCSSQNSLEIFIPLSVSWGFPPGLVSWSHPENLQGKGSPLASLDVKSGSWVHSMKNVGPPKSLTVAPSVPDEVTLQWSQKNIVPK